jgi:hypothetical protein
MPRVSCHGDQIRHARDRIGGLRNRHELGEGTALSLSLKLRSFIEFVVDRFTA